MQREVKSASINLFVGGGDDSFDSVDSAKEEYGKIVTLQQDLVSELEDKNRAIEHLNILLEAITPVPGFDPEKYRRLILAKNSGDKDAEDVDPRDSKIVTLAKKCRNLTMQLTKEKSESDRLRQDVKELSSIGDRLRDELMISNAKANNLPLAGKRSTIGNVPQDEDYESLKKEMSSMNKQVEEFRRKLIQSKDECKMLRNTLSRELGEGISIEEAMEGNWRGRAQQIIMLKAKVRKLEGQLQSRGKEDADTVDAKAEHTIADMGNERKHMIEVITEEHRNLTIQNKELETKLSSHKARIRNIEGDLSKARQQMQVVLEKTDSDDKLIEALKAEIDRLKFQLRTQQLAFKDAQENVRGHTIDRKGRTMMNVDDGGTARLQAEIMRLERICKTQAEQLSTQEMVIRDLRKSLKPY